MDDIVSLLLYILMIVAALVVSAYQAKRKKSQQGQGTPVGGNQTNRGAGGRPDFGPLTDFFDMGEGKQQPPLYETLEAGPSVEEGAAEVERSAAYEPMNAGNAGSSMASPEVEDAILADRRFEEGQSDLIKSSAAVDDLGLYEEDAALEDIAAGEIVSEEEAAKAAAAKSERERLDMRKAIIYSEILKRREF